MDDGIDIGRVRNSLANVDGKLTLQGPKTSRSRRSLMLEGTVLSALRAHWTRQLMERLVAGSRWVETGHVFASTIGTPLHAATVTLAFQAALERAGLPHSRCHEFEQRQEAVAKVMDAVLGPWAQGEPAVVRARAGCRRKGHR